MLGRSREADPLSVWEALGEEHESLGGELSDDYRRLLERYRTARAAWHASSGDAKAGAEAEYAAVEKQLRDALFAVLHRGQRSALCFSGGGIRSATFGLGVMQSLAGRSWQRPEGTQPDRDPALLAELDYLSTVSGGGYLGGWFSSWAAREPGGTGAVIRQLAVPPDEKLDPEPLPVRHLRTFSNYLNPRLGLLSADTWTLVSTITRNMLLNWLVLLPLLAAVLTLPRLLRALVISPHESMLQALLWTGFAGGVAATAFLVYDLPSSGNARKSQRWFLLMFLLPLAINSLAMTTYWAWLTASGGTHTVFQVMRFALAMLGAGLLLGAPFAIRSRGAVSFGWILNGVFFTLLTGALAGFVTHDLAQRFVDPGGGIADPVLYTWLAFPALMTIFVLGEYLMTGLASLITEDEDREWWARAGAWQLIVLFVWLIFTGIVLYGPEGFMALKALATAALGAIASRLGFSPKTTAGRRNEDHKPLPSLPKSKMASELGSRLIIPAFLVLLVMSLATFSQWIAGEPQSPLAELSLAVLFTVPALLMARFVNANKFSLNAMYRARLIRAFLGASNRKRNADQFTGFDPADNIAMHDLPARPLHVVNMALNLVKGENLAWQQRKAESFTASRLHSGSCRVGYQPSKRYAGEDGISLGGAVSISGAAASPNMGYNSSSLLTIIMTLFNARLGAWLANPGEEGRGIWTREAPTYAVRPFIDEAFGLTTDTNAWIYLSDGGHFDNLGLYEMVLRRCRTIVVADAGADPAFTFEDLGNAVRKIRVDMGIPIEFPGGIQISGARGAAVKHCAIGRIQYSCVDSGAPDGTLVYIKPSINGNEPPDVANYASQHSLFPHEPTPDQWFDEPQFESYRRLGSHIIEEICGPDRAVLTLAQFVERAELYANHAAKQAAT